MSVQKKSLKSTTKSGVKTRSTVPAKQSKNLAKSKMISLKTMRIFHDDESPKET